MKLRTLGLLAAAVAGMAIGTSAKAAAILSLAASGTDWVNITDNGAAVTSGGAVSDATSTSDGTGAVGAVSWTGTILSGGTTWSITVSSGQTKPALGTATLPVIATSIHATSNGAGTLTLAFGDTGFTYSGGVLAQISGSNTNATATASLRQDGSAVGLAQAGVAGTNVITLGPITGFASNAVGVGGVAGSNYSLTQYVTLNATGAAAISLNDTLAVALPVPAAAWMGISTLAGVGGLGVLRRRARQA